MDDLVKFLRLEAHKDFKFAQAADRIEQLEHMVKDINEYEDEIEQLQEMVKHWEDWHYWRIGSPPELSDRPPPPEDNTLASTDN